MKANMVQADLWERGWKWEDWNMETGDEMYVLIEIQEVGG